MNKHEHQATDSVIDQRQLDRLVDGELSETERRELLRKLDRQPITWRQCALSFIESQMWQDELTPNQATDRSPASVRPARARSMHYVGWLATAAAAMLAFTLGQRFETGQRQAVQSDQFAERAPAATTSLRPSVGSPTQWYAGRTLPDDVERLLREMGAEVRQRQGWVVRNSEGQPTMVPYRDVELVPARGPAY